MLDEKYCLRPEELKKISSMDEAQRLINTICKESKETIQDKSAIAVVEPRNLNEVCLIGIELLRHAIPDNIHVFVLNSGFCSKERVRKVEKYFIDKGIGVTHVDEAGTTIARNVKQGKTYWPYAIGNVLINRYYVRGNYTFEAVFSDQEYEKLRGSNLLRHIHSDTLTGGMKRITPTGWLYQSEVPLMIKALKIDTSICSKHSFRNEKFYLSNFYPTRIEVKEGDTTYVFPSAQNYYEACKFETVIEKQMMSDLTPISAKELGEKISNVIWDKETKLKVMRRVLEAKFTQNVELMEQLLSEEDENLVEKNNLGKLLLQIKEKYKNLM